jgi:putative DNA primase/helicase
MKSTFTYARFFRNCGYSVIPVMLDGTKKPAQSWAYNQKKAASEDELIHWFGNDEHGIGLVQGKVSGNAELLEFETLDIYEQWEQSMQDHGLAPLSQKLSLRVQSGGGGIHLYYRVPTGAVQGNQRLAEALSKVEGKNGNTIIETRGEGGYVVAPGSPVGVHSTKLPYRIIGGSFAQVPVLTTEERKTLFDICRLFNEVPVKEKYKPRQERDGYISIQQGGRPGDDFDERGSDRALACLLKHGWSVERDFPFMSLRRPGKESGVSASFDYVAPGVLYVFSSNAQPFENERAYSPFEIVTVLDHGGDFKSAAKSLRAQGYGEQPHYEVPSMTPEKVVNAPVDATALQTEGLVFRMRFLMASETLEWPVERPKDISPVLVARIVQSPPKELIEMLMSDLASKKRGQDSADMLEEIDYVFDYGDYYIDNADAMLDFGMEGIG